MDRFTSASPRLKTKARIRNGAATCTPIRKDSATTEDISAAVHAKSGTPSIGTIEKDRTIASSMRWWTSSAKMNTIPPRTRNRSEERRVGKECVSVDLGGRRIIKKKKQKKTKRTKKST